MKSHLEEKLKGMSDNEIENLLQAFLKKLDTNSKITLILIVLESIEFMY